MDEDFELVMSPLCREVTIDGVWAEISIYKSETGDWILEVQDADGTSTIWDDRFATDQLAMEQFEQTVREEGIGSITGPVDES